MNLLVIPALIICQMAFAQKSKKIGEIKGIDFKAGFSLFDYSGNDAIKIYSSIVSPDLDKNGKTPNGYENGYSYNYSWSYYLGVVSSKNELLKSNYFKKSEARFGLNFENFSSLSGMFNCDVKFKNDTTSNLIDGIIKYFGYGVHADYTINSKPFMNHFATYFSFGTTVMLHNFKAVGESKNLFERGTPHFYNYNIEMTNTKTSLTSVDFKVFWGVKYNLSCDFNLFMESCIGGSYYNKGLYNNHKWLWLFNFTPIGIRYKFVKPEDKSKTKLNVFW